MLSRHSPAAYKKLLMVSHAASYPCRHGPQYHVFQSLIRVPYMRPSCICKLIPTISQYDGVCLKFF